MFYSRDQVWTIKENLGSGSVSTERDIEISFAGYLREKGLNPRRQVQCWCGTADIVTDDAIYEVKKNLDRESLFRAIGQVLLYRMAINPIAAPKIVTNQILAPQEVISTANAIGVDVIQWSAGGHEERAQFRAAALDEKVVSRLTANGGWMRVRELHQSISNGVRGPEIREALARLQERGVVISRKYGDQANQEEWSIDTSEDES